MKSKYILITIGLSAMMTSCSVFNSLMGTDKKTDTTENVSEATPAAPSTTAGENAKPGAAPGTTGAAGQAAAAFGDKAPKADKKKADKKKKKGTTTPAPVVKEEHPTVPTAEELCGGQWTVTAVGEMQIVVDEDVPYVNFDNEGRFYASDGCNILNGSYALKSDGKLTFANVLSTMKYCPEVDYSSGVGAMLADGSEYMADCKRIGQDTYLYLKNAAGKTVATLRRHNMEFLNGAWLIKKAEGKDINDEEANVFIDIAELKVHGNTGCNYFNGDIYIDPTRSNAIDFSNMGVTRMACPKSEQEHRILVALESAASAIAGKNSDTVLLLDGAGKEVMTLKRTKILPSDE